jgi:hypothetical protein
VGFFCFFVVVVFGVFLGFFFWLFVCAIRKEALFYPKNNFFVFLLTKKQKNNHTIVGREKWLLYFQV